MQVRNMNKSEIMLFQILVKVALIVITTASTCPPHDFSPKGIGYLTISIRSTLTWETKKKSSVIGITLSSNSDRGSRTITKDFYIRSSVLICSKCGAAKGIVFMTFDQLKRIVSRHPVLNPLLTKAIETRPV